MEGSIKSRIDEYCKYMGLSVRNFCERIGAANGYFKPALKSISPEYRDKIKKEFPELNLSWLVLGEGEMLRDSSMLKIHNPPYPEAVHERVEVPLYDVKASANLSMTMDQERENVIGYISIPNMPSVDGAVAVVGDSMYPIIKSGDIVVFKWVRSPEYITFGEMYLISYMWDDDKHVAVKYVKRSKMPEHITLVSYNSNYDPIDIPVQNIQSIALVKVSIRYNTII